VNIEVPAIIAPSVTEHSIFSQDLIEELMGKNGAKERKGEDATYHVRFTLGGRKIQTLVHAGTVPRSTARAVIGRRDLTGYYIDPVKITDAPVIRPQIRVNLRAVDRMLAQADVALLLLKYLKPINLPEERLRLEEDPSYSPLFLYPDTPFDVDALQGKLQRITCDDSSLGQLLRKKQRELLLRIDLIRARGDSERFTAASKALFGTPYVELLHSAQAYLDGYSQSKEAISDGEFLSAQQAAEVFEGILAKYGLHDWQVSVRSALVADCTVGWKRLYLRKGARFSREHVGSLIAHEIETHILTSENGAQQPFSLFKRGFANYLDTQEGLAVFNQNRVLSAVHEKRKGPARSVLAVAYALEHSFVDTRRHLMEHLGYQPAKALTKTLELKRGLHDPSEPGCFTKSLVYYRGQRAIEHFVAAGGDLKRLYTGKIALEDLELSEQVPGLKKPALIPGFLRTTEHAQ
jgi:uncharacterized protein (TIGR02421 family)